jgi:ATP-dependent helicase HrpB
MKTVPVSQASAIQRAGRAARQGPGICVRLYTQTDFEQRMAFEIPEMKRADLAPVYLELLQWTEPRNLPWLEPPGEGQLKSAESLLHLLGAIDAGGELTELGKKIARSPLHPRLAKMVLSAVSVGLEDEAILFAAEEMEGVGFQGEVSLDQVLLKDRGLGMGARRLVSQTQQWLSREIEGTPPKDKRLKMDSHTQGAAWNRIILQAFPDRVAKRKKGQSQYEKESEWNLAMGGTAWLSQPWNSGEWLVAVQVFSRQKKFQGPAGAHLNAAPKIVQMIESFVPIDEGDLLELPGLEEVERIEIHPKNGRTEKVTELRIQNLVLIETRSEVSGAEAAFSGLWMGYQTPLKLKILLGQK